MNPALKAELEQVSGWVIPEHDVLEWLLNILPKRTADIAHTVLLGRATNNDGWSIVYLDWCFIGETPTSAAAQLAITLFQQNILTKEQI